MGARRTVEVADEAHVLGRQRRAQEGGPGLRRAQAGTGRDRRNAGDEPVGHTPLSAAAAYVTFLLLGLRWCEQISSDSRAVDVRGGAAVQRPSRPRTRERHLRLHRVRAWAGRWAGLGGAAQGADGALGG